MYLHKDTFALWIYLPCLANCAPMYYYFCHQVELLCPCVCTMLDSVLDQISKGCWNHRPSAKEPRYKCFEIKYASSIYYLNRNSNFFLNLRSSQEIPKKSKPIVMSSVLSVVFSADLKKHSQLSATSAYGRIQTNEGYLRSLRIHVSDQSPRG